MKVAVLGTGLIGGSIGLALKRARPEVEVVAFDRDPQAAARAVERGAADRAMSDPRAAVTDADVVFIATPVGAIADVARSVADALSPGCVLTDVGSTKLRVAVEVEKALPDGVTFIGGHPMAGTEDEGIDAAANDLFDGAWWVLTPTDRTDAAGYRVLHGLVTAVGARVMALKPAAHDRLMATVSHVPHLTATALMTMAAAEGEEHAGLLALAAGGFRDVTRVAASNPEIWLDICDENADAIAGALEGFAERLTRLGALVKAGDRDGLRAVFLAAREARRSLPHKEVAGDLFEIRAPVPDRPGVLAEVTTTVGDLGINIEDLQLTHSAEGGRGTLTLAVTGADHADRVVVALGTIGLDARAIQL